MKKKLIAKMSVLLASIMLVCVSLTGCFGDGGSEPKTKEYTIQYSDDAGTHILTVTEGMPYTLESVPHRFGYEFLGLYDAQTGGTQYVGANGASLAPYSDKGNKVLFPQFKPIEYTVILDYGEANITGDRSFTVTYNTNLPELPKNLSLAHNVFTGWYTEAGGKGTQVADAFGNLPAVSVLNEEYFKLDDSKRVYLYAGFELEKYTVTFHFEDGMPSEEVKVPYNTPISQVVPKTRNEEGKAGLSWSKSADGDVFNGNVTESIDLYVREWAPVIELNGNGADVTPIVAKAGTAITLPVPTKPLAKFLRWVDENNETAELTIMPATSVTLTAVWQAKIEFDENGGTDVDDISKPAGESISLPTPTKEGYLFAGWYTADKEEYTASKMPSTGIALKAGWYKEETDQKVLIPSSEYASTMSGGPYIGGNSDTSFVLKYSDYFSEGTYNISVAWHVKLKWDRNAAGTGYFEIYNSNIISSSSLILKKSFQDIVSNSYREYTFTTNFQMSDDIYFCWYRILTSGESTWIWPELCLRDYYYTISYPDTTYLYL